MTTLLGRLAHSYSHRGFSPVVRLPADFLTVLTVWSGLSGLHFGKPFKRLRMFIGCFGHRAKAAV